MKQRNSDRYQLGCRSNFGEEIQQMKPQKRNNADKKRRVTDLWLKSVVVVRVPNCIIE